MTQPIVLGGSLGKGFECMRAGSCSLKVTFYENCLKLRETFIPLASGNSSSGSEKYLCLQLERMVLAKQDMHFHLGFCS